MVHFFKKLLCKHRRLTLLALTKILPLWYKKIKSLSIFNVLKSFAKFWGDFSTFYAFLLIFIVADGKNIEKQSA